MTKKLLPLCILMATGFSSQLSWADSLNDIYQQAKENDPVLLGMKAQKDQAFEAIRTTKSVLLPQINLSGSYTYTETEEDLFDSSLATAGLSFSQKLYDPSSWINLETSEKKARQMDAQYADTEQNLMLRVVKAYFEVLKAKDNLAFVRAEKASVARQLEQMKQRFEVGLSAITDVHDAQAQYDSVLADEVLAENSLANSYEGIREITGKASGKLDVLDTTRFSVNPPSQALDQLIQNAEQKNLSLLESRIAKDIAKDNIELADSGHLPSLSLTGGYQFQDENNSSNTYYAYYKNGFSGANIGLNLSIPLYEGGKINSETKQARFAFVKASQDLEAAHRLVVKNVRAYRNNINASIGAVRAYQQSVISAQSALKATEAGFDVGTRTIVDVLDATRRLYSANKNLSDARYDYIINQIELKKSVGSLSEQDINAINSGLKPQS